MKYAAIAAMLIFAVLLLSGRKDAAAPQPAPSPLTTITWRLEEYAGEDSTLHTRIFADAAYADGSTDTIPVDDAAGSCNEIDPSAEDADMLEGTTKIQCYAAGLGHWYKIVASGGEYRVLCKTFEEALPDYTPPAYEYEVVATVAGVR